MKRNLGIFIVMFLAVLLVASCSKMAPTEPDRQDEPEDPVVPVDVTVTASVLGVDAVDNTYMSGVSVYTQEGEPATYRPWPAEGRNTTPIEPNDIELGHYLFVGVKAGHDTAYSPLEVTAADTMLNVYLVMHKTQAPTDTTSTPVIPTGLNGNIHFDTVTREIEFTGSIFGTAGYDSVCFDGSIYNMRFEAIHDGCKLIVEDYYTFANTFFGGRYNLTGWWYYHNDGSGRDGNCITYNADGLEWYREGTESWWKLGDRPVLTYKVEIKAVDPTNPSILLNGNLVSPGIYDCMANGNTISATHPEYYNWGPHAFDGIPNGTKVIEIDMDKIPPTTYHLTVNSGYGDGDYVEGTVVNIYADAPMTDYHFVGWTGDISYVTDLSNSETTVTMPAKDITVTATYEQDTPLPVNPLRIEYSDGHVRLYGDGHENWQGIETWVGIEVNNQGPPWYNNQWVKAIEVTSEYTRFVMPANALYKYVHFWADAVPGEEDAGGSGVPPMFADYANLQAGTGVNRINVTPGHVVLNR